MLLFTCCPIGKKLTLIWKEKNSLLLMSNLPSNLPLKVKMFEHSKSLSMLMSSRDMLRTFLYASPQCATLGLGSLLKHSHSVLQKQ